jgi:hypothetical protein
MEDIGHHWLTLLGVPSSITRVGLLQKAMVFQDLVCPILYIKTTLYTTQSDGQPPLVAQINYNL